MFGPRKESTFLCGGKEKRRREKEKIYQRRKMSRWADRHKIKLEFWTQNSQYVGGKQEACVYGLWGNDGDGDDEGES